MTNCAWCATPEDGEIAVAVPDESTLDALIADLPPMMGAEYLTQDVLMALWSQLDSALRGELSAAKLPLQAYLKACHPAWNQVGRVYFNLAENRKDADASFAFLATYTSQLSAHGKAQLLSLLLPVQRAAEQCAWLREMVEEGDLYHPLRWTPQDAWLFLSDVPKLEAAGIVVRALVMGSSLYSVEVSVATVPAKQWQAIGADCSGSIDSLVELLQGKLSKAVMERICKPGTGLFPSPREIKFKCSCPDWASMFKHVAAVLYGAGARLDSQPELLFGLRRGDAKDLVAQAGAGLPKAKKGPKSSKLLDQSELGDVFGIEMAEAAPKPAVRRGKAATPKAATARMPRMKSD